MSNNYSKIKVRARAIDLLGRQQIAGIPTAIHELFKNAYDAFATRVEVDVLEKQKVLVIRDNGFGMTPDDFLNRWLTVGTESKVGIREHSAPFIGEHGKIVRRVMGEKGIGRLAIASIGPAVLILSRAIRENGMYDLTACLIHWALFEIPGIDLDIIKIPIRTFPGGTLPKAEDISDMIETISENLADIKNRFNITNADQINRQLAGMKFDLQSFMPSLVDGNISSELTLEGNGHGTCFIIRPYDTVLDSDIDMLNDEMQEQVPKLQKLLLGFGNTMIPGVESPQIKTAFRCHGPSEVIDIIAQKSFLTPEEFAQGDQIIKGKFDEYGQFIGTVKVYNLAPIPYTLAWKGAKGNKSICGPFEIQFSYIMGNSWESLLEPEQYALLGEKLKRAGGLYIYRDGIRVLPYGDSDYDFLNIERRRNLAAKDWFFSYRRMFGAIMINGVQNSSLQEKAGREGFMENIAYRQFRDIIEGLLRNLALDFFRKTGQLADDFIEFKEEFKRQNELLKKREKQTRAKKVKFQSDLELFFEKVEKGDSSIQVTKLKRDIIEKFERVSILDDPDKMGVELQKIQQSFYNSLNAIRDQFKVSKPSGIGLSKSLTSDWNAYRITNSQLEEKEFGPLQQEFNELFRNSLKDYGEAIDKRQLLQRILTERRELISKDIGTKRKKAEEGLKLADRAVFNGLKTSMQRFHFDLETVNGDLERTQLSEMDPDEFSKLSEVFERRLESISEREGEFLARLRNQLQVLAEALDGGVLPDDVTEALENRNNALQEEIEDSLHWSQVGMALGIVQHEFNGVVRKIKSDISFLKPWADGTPQLKGLVTDLRSGFLHLEEYLRLFAPLDRRMNRQKIDLSGKEIAQYIQSIFGDRFQRHAINLVTTDNFLRQTVNVYPSTLLPVFINLVDNACHWLSSDNENKREIFLDRNDDGLIVGNTGPGIENRYADRIFEFGFSTKDNGRGMGLNISKKALNGEGMDLELMEAGINNQPKFLIRLERSKE